MLFGTTRNSTATFKNQFHSFQTSLVKLCMQTQPMRGQPPRSQRLKNFSRGYFESLNLCIYSLILLVHCRGHWIGLRGLRGCQQICAIILESQIIQNIIFRSHLSSPKLLSDLDLGGPYDLRFDLRGRSRPNIVKIFTDTKYQSCLLCICKHSNCQDDK